MKCEKYGFSILFIDVLTNKQHYHILVSYCSSLTKSNLPIITQKCHYEDVVDKRMRRRKNIDLIITSATLT